MPGGRDLWFCLVVKTHSLSGPSIRPAALGGYACFCTRFARRGARFIRLFLHALRAEGRSVHTSFFARASRGGAPPLYPAGVSPARLLAQRCAGAPPPRPQAYSAAASVFGGRIGLREVRRERSSLCALSHYAL